MVVGDDARVDRVEAVLGPVVIISPTSVRGNVAMRASSLTPAG